MRLSCGCLAAALLLAAGCAQPTDCDLQTTRIDVIYGSTQETLDRNAVTALKGQGWTCKSVPIRDQGGTETGLAYTCTICR